MQVNTKDIVYEIRSERWQKIFATCLFLFLIAITVVLFLQLADPAQFPNFSIQKTSSITKFLYYVFGASIFFTGFYIWWSTMNYVLCANETGLLQSDGFRTIFVPWIDINSWIWKQAGRSKRMPSQPVLMNRSGDVIFYPFNHVLASTGSADQRKTLFWKLVLEKIDSTTKKTD